MFGNEKFISCVVKLYGLTVSTITSTGGNDGVMENIISFLHENKNVNSTK